MMMGIQKLSCGVPILAMCILAFMCTGLQVASSSGSQADISPGLQVQKGTIVALVDGIYTQSEIPVRSTLEENPEEEKTDEELHPGITLRRNIGLLVVTILFLLACISDGFHYIQRKYCTPSGEITSEKTEDGWIVKYFIIFWILLIVLSTYAPDNYTLYFD